jgi:hypothetical protein
MTMQDWITKLDEFLKISGRELLAHAGKISAESAKEKAELEYGRYRKLQDTQPRTVDADFEKAAKLIQKLPRSKRAKIPKSYIDGAWHCERVDWAAQESRLWV